MNQKKRRKLSNIIINPRYQLKYVAWIVLVSLLLVALFASLAYRFLEENYSILVDLSPMTDDVKELLYVELGYYYQKLIIMSVVFLLTVVVLSLRISHKVAGPLYQFKNTFVEIQNGNRKKRISLRPGDEFHDIAQTFNAMMDQIEESTSKSPPK